VFLIGNKSDLEEERKISKEKAENFKNDYELDLFMETSAKTGMNAQELFIEAAKILFNDYSKYKLVRSKREGGEVLKSENAKKVQKKGCCK
jgi:GTPase SAR1 family protein